MAENKKSFVLYCDMIHMVRKLKKERQADLFMLILEYVNDENPEVTDEVLEPVFESIKVQLKRDLKRYENIIERNRNNGKKGGRPKKEPKKPNGLNGNPNNPVEPKKADSVSDTDSVNDILLEKETKVYRCFAHLTLSTDDFNKLELDYYKEDIDSALDSIENYTGNKKYKSLYLTCKNWLKDKRKKSEETINNKSGTNQLQPKYENDEYYR